jgi:RimJ/RimL family protein N-acetyltransferase
LELLEIQAEVLFTQDHRGRIVSSKEPGGNPAPRFFLGRTKEGNLWRVRHDVSEGTARDLESLAAAEPVRDDQGEPPERLAELLAVLGNDGEARVDFHGPAYRFPDALPEPANVTRVTRANLHLLHRIVPDLEELEREFERGQPSMAVIVDGAAVAECYSSCSSDRAAEVGVVTLEDYRGRGYAYEVVAAWALAVREAGRIPLYSTTWDNLASQAVARKLGLVQYATELSLE